MAVKNIGINVPAPKEAKGEQDKKSPFSGGIKLHGRQFVCTVVSAKMRRSAVVEWERRYFLRKYERYERRMTRITVHVPVEIQVAEGDKVRISECRPLSKTKTFVIIENLGQERGYSLKKEGREASRVEHPVETKVKDEKPAEAKAENAKKKSGEEAK